MLQYNIFSGVLFVWCVRFVLCLIVVPLPRVKTHLQFNNINNNNLDVVMKHKLKPFQRCVRRTQVPHKLSHASGIVLL
jgi:hypothetical protein